jgi:hypothetical protein
MADLESGVGFSFSVDTGAGKNVPDVFGVQNLGQHKCPSPISEAA